MTTSVNQPLPLFYNELVPLQIEAHRNFRIRTSTKAPFLVGEPAVPLTTDEFVRAQRDYPIVFTLGEASVPLALMGLSSGVNVFVDANGTFRRDAYLPAYVRRYPFMLARLAPEAAELVLCFDRSSDLVGPTGGGEALFEGGAVSEAANQVLEFCEEFELAAQRTAAFVQELVSLNLLMPGEITCQVPGEEEPYIYGGFQMVDEDKLRDLNADSLRKLNQRGGLTLIMAHLFSLNLIPSLAARQLKAPEQHPVNAGAEEATNG